MMELFIGCNSLITLGIVMHHMDFATKAISDTESGQYNDMGLYCFVLMIFAILMKVYMGMVSGYMGSLSSSTFNDWNAAPNYKTITIYTVAIFVVYAGTVVGGAFSVYSILLRVCETHTCKLQVLVSAVSAVSAGLHR